MILYQIYESGNYLIIDTYDDVARVVTASAQYAKKNSYYNKTADGYVITEFGGGEFPILLTDINDNIWTDNAAVPLSESEIVDILQNHTGNFKSAAGGSAAVGAVLTKTGQVTSFRTGDDGGLQAGRAVDFFTLENAGPFGTKRFTDELGGQTYANDIVIDWSTYDVNLGKVLGYYLGDTSYRTWNNYIDWALALSVGTFTTGWRAWNNKELLNLFNYSTSRAVNYAPFNTSLTLNIGNYSRYLWTSTTHPTTTTNAFRTDVAAFVLQLHNKANTNQCVAVRTFTVSGTTLS